jgi:hypothetical protein
VQTPDLKALISQAQFTIFEAHTLGTQEAQASGKQQGGGQTHN